MNQSSPRRLTSIDGLPSRRFLLSGIAGVGAAMALGACSSGKSGGSAANEVKKGPGPGGYKIDLGGYQGPEPSSSQATIRFMRQDYTPAVNAQFQSLYKKFSEAYPNIQVKEEIVPYGDLATKLQVYVAANDAPDLMMGRNDFTMAYAAGQTALPLNGYFTESFIQDIHSPLRAAGSVDGKLYCSPWDNNVEVLYFNKDIFARAGVELPPESADSADAWTYDEFVTALQALKTNLRAKGDTKTWALAASTAGNGGPGSNYTQHESFWVRMMGDPNAAKGSDSYRTWAGLSADGLTSTGYLNADGAVRGMQNYQHLFAAGLTPTGVIPDQLTAGTSAMSFDSFSVANYYALPANKPKFNWGVTPWPKGVSEFNCNSSDAPIIWAKTQNPDATAALLGYLLNDENRIAFARLWGSIPARNSLIKKMPEYSQEKQRLAVSLIQKSSPAPRSVGWFDYFNAVNPAVKDIALGANPAQTLTSTAKLIDRNLAKYR